MSLFSEVQLILSSKSIWYKFQIKFLSESLTFWIKMGVGLGGRGVLNVDNQSLVKSIFLFPFEPKKMGEFGRRKTSLFNNE